MKICNICDIEKEIISFDENRNVCRKCRTKQNNKSISNYKLKSRYGIDIDEYNIIFSNQNGCCVICGIHQSILYNKLAVDHDHTTGKVRGLLCMNCNTAIGKFNDDIKLLEKAIEYLKRWEIQLIRRI